MLCRAHEKHAYQRRTLLSYCFVTANEHDTTRFILLNESPPPCPINHADFLIAFINCACMRWTVAGV